MVFCIQAWPKVKPEDEKWHYWKNQCRKDDTFFRLPASYRHELTDCGYKPQVSGHHKKSQGGFRVDTGKGSYFCLILVDYEY